MDDRFNAAPENREQTEEADASSPENNSLVDFNDLMRESNNISNRVEHPQPGLPKLEVGPNANKPEEFIPVEHHTLPGSRGGERFRFYRDDENRTMEHEAVYQPKGTGYSNWFREDGTKTHTQFFNWNVDAFVQEGKVGIQNEMATQLGKIDEYDASGKNVVNRYLFDANGNIKQLRTFNERGGTSSLMEFRPDGTLQTKTDYAGGRAHRKSYSQEEDIRVKIDPYLLRKPYLTDKDEVYPKF